jgi:hypothetical protein
VILANVFGPGLLISVLLSMAVPLWAIIDILSRPAVAFYAAGSNKTAWVIVLLVATFVFGIGLLFAAYYLIGIRRKVVRQQMQLAYAASSRRT